MNTGDNAWVLASSAMVLLMTPGLAMFYGGISRAQNVLSTIMQCFFVMGLASIIWLLWGFSLSFSPDAFWGLVGGTDYLFLHNLRGVLWPNTQIPGVTFMIFQCMFAVLTPALICGAFAERMKFGAFILFMALWITIVYCPICHWVWGPGGWLVYMGVLDYAGGTVVHISSGMAGLACALLIGKRSGFGVVAMKPSNLPITLLGAGLLWFGWFGFNAGSALAANETAAFAFTATQLAAGAAALSWVFAEWLIKGKPTTLGIASGVIAGLVAVTPAAGFVSPVWATVIGLVAGVLCYGAVLAKNVLGFDDSFDVVGLHAVGGAWGSIATGLFAANEFGGISGFIDGNAAQLVPQVTAIAATAVYSFVATSVLLVVVEIILGVRATEDQEKMGLDTTVHGESGYSLS